MDALHALRRTGLLHDPRRSMLLSRLLIGVSLAMPAAALAQTQAAKPALQFDVVSIKPHKAGENNSMWRWSSAGYEATNTSLKDMIASVYGVKAWLVFGLPPWAEADRWDMQAKVTDAAATPLETLSPEDRRTLVGSVLKDRFGLTVHTESKVQPVFDMTVLPEGARIRESPPPPAGSETPKFGRGTSMINTGSMKATYITMDRLGEMIAYLVERSIINKTGLKGEYDLELKWTPEDHASADNGVAGDAPPAFFDAMKQQLGLKLSPAKAPVATVVVDSIERPEAN